MARLIPDEMLDEVAVSGTYDTIGKKLDDKYAGLLDRISLYQPYTTTVNDAQLAGLMREFEH
jgi:hypothetical protein